MAGPSDPFDRVIDALGHLGMKPRRQGDGFEAHCPAHPDRNPSLSVRRGDKQEVVILCHAFCDTAEVVAKLGMTMADLCVSDGGRGGRKSRREVAAYRYEDENGVALFDVVRYDPKAFRQRRPDGTWKLNGVRRVPYHLPALLVAVAGH